MTETTPARGFADLDPLMSRILAEYALPFDGYHGPVHWARVLENGLRLADRTGADPEIVRLFAILHDARRVNEAIDDGHGARAARFAEGLRGELIDLDEARFELLRHACAHHTDGLTDADVTVQTCWDSDRLDLGRVWITPRPRYLCTPAAKEPETIRWAHARAIEGYTPEVARRWLALG